MEESSKTRSKWALLVGIDEYRSLGNQIQLAGCVNDVRLLSEILPRFGFSIDRIRRLENDKATRNGILNALHELSDQIASGDTVVIHFSCLGSTMTDREGDESDGLDETIVPFDSGRGQIENRDITDDELYSCINKLSQKTPDITVIFDTAHSGSIQRDTLISNSRWLEPDLRPVSELPPSQIHWHDLGGDIGPSDWLPVSDRYVVIAACQASGRCHEHTSILDGKVAIYGALTYFLARELALAVPGCTYREIFARLYLSIATSYPSQVPQIEGAIDRELFAPSQHESRPFTSVTQRDRASATLDIGALHGATKGSRWGIYPAGTIDNSTEKLGLVQLEEMELLSTRARILAESEQGAIAPGTIAREEAHFFGEMRLLVKLVIAEGHEQQVAELERRLERSWALSQITEAEGADAVVYLLAPRLNPIARGPVPQLGKLEAPTWAVIARDGELLIPPVLASEPGAAYQIGDFLERYGRYRFALGLRNENPESKLTGLIDFELLTKSNDGSWKIADPEGGAAYPAFHEGDYLAFRIRNRSARRLFVTIIDFGVTWRLDQVYPSFGSYEGLDPGKEVECFTLPGDQIGLYLPEDYSRYGLRDWKFGAGVEVLKLIATPYPIDFAGIFLQDGLRGLNPLGSGTQLAQLLDTALTGYGRREVWDTRVSEEEDWTTLERPFLLRPVLDRKAGG